MTMETEFISFLTNQGLAIGIAIFLVWWVTTQMGTQLRMACDNQTKLCENQLKMAQAMDSMLERLDNHDKQAKEILLKVNGISDKL